MTPWTTTTAAISSTRRWSNAGRRPAAHVSRPGAPVRGAGVLSAGRLAAMPGSCAAATCTGRSDHAQPSGRRAVRLPGPQPRGDVVDGHRTGEVPALHQVAAHRCEQVPGRLVLHALGDDVEAEMPAEVDDGPHDCDVLVPGAQAGDE